MKIKTKTDLKRRTLTVSVEEILILEAKGRREGDTEKAYPYIRRSKENSVIAIVTPTKMRVW